MLISHALVSVTFAQSEYSTGTLNLSVSENLVLSCKGAKNEKIAVKLFQGKKTLTSRVALSKLGKANFSLRTLFPKQLAKKGIKGKLALSSAAALTCKATAKAKKKNNSIPLLPVLPKEVVPAPSPTPSPTFAPVIDLPIDPAPTPTPIALASPSPSSSPTPTPTPTPTPSPTATPTPSPTSSSVPSPSPAATVSPSPQRNVDPAPAAESEPRDCEIAAVDLTASIEPTKLSETSRIDRATRKTVNTVVLALKNISQEPLLAPVSAKVVVHFAAPANAGAVTLNGQAMEGAAPGDLTKSIALDELAPGASVQKTLVFENASTVRFSWTLLLFAKCPATTEETSLPPVVTIPQEAYSVQSGNTLEFPVSATDPDNDFVSLSGGPRLKNCLFQTSTGHNPTGLFRFIPEPGQVGQFDFNFVARDDTGLAGTKSVRVNVLHTNGAPVLNGPATAQVQVGKSVTLSLDASDPDGDVLSISASNLPANGVFVEATRSFTFSPDSSQVGVVAPSFAANDGVLSSSVYQPQVTVLPGPTDGGGGPAALNLEVNSIASPVLDTKVRVTGAVNTQLGAPPTQSTIALINGLVPSTGEQGKTLNVQMSSADGNFVSGSSTASFGDGIAVNSFTVTDENSAVANITIASDAAIGPRSIQVVTGSESAVSVLAFNVLRGKSLLRGRLVDPDTGLPIQGARVTIEGTSFSAVTGLDGAFVFLDAPGGFHTLIVNAPNRDLQRIEFDSESGEEIDLGDFGTPSLAFDPGAPSSASVGSVLGRGAADPSARLTFEQAKQIVIDAIIATGGNEGGVLDEFGNQLNPNVSGNGLISAPNGVVEDQAFQLMKGETRPLYEYLLGFSFGFEWQPGERPSLVQWINALQRQVNEAWQEPNKLENRIVVMIFSQGRTVTPTPPKITYETRLTATQAYLLTSSWLAYSAKVAPEFASLSIGDRFSDVFISTAYAQTVPQGPISSLTDWYKGITTKDFNTAYKGKVVDAFGGAFGNVVLNSMGRQAQVPGLENISSAIVGGFTDVLTGYLVKLNLIALTPRPPLILDAEKMTEKFASGEEFDTAVVLRTTRTYGDAGAANPPGKRFIYRLWRKNADIIERISIGPIPERRKQDDPAGGPFLDPQDPTKFIFLDFNPKDGHNVYYVDVERSIGENPYNNPPEVPLWTKFLPQPSFGVKGWSMLGSFNPVGALTAIMGPMQSLANGIRRMTSPMSNGKAVWVGKGIRAGSTPAGGMEIDPNKRQVFVSYPSESRVDVLNLETLQKVASFDPGFKAPPAQSGLAINSAGELFSENAASDESYGGKIFKYEAWTFARTHVGMTNYFSFLLGYARPTSVPAMCIAPDDNLYVLDASDQQVKKVAVTATYDPYRRVGQPVLSGPLLAGIGGANTDMASDFNNKVYITKGPNVIVGDLSNGSSRPLFSSSFPFQTVRSVTFDGMHNMYLAGAAYPLSGTGVTEAIAVIPPTLQQTMDSFSDPTHCKFDKHLFIQNLSQAGLTRIDPSGRLIVFLDNGIPRFQVFGLSGQIKDKFGQPVAGALVSAGGPNFASSKPSKTNACGTYHIMNLMDPDQQARTAELTVSTAELGSQRYLVGLETYGQTFRDIVFDPQPLQDQDPPPQKEIDPIPPIPTEVTLEIPDPIIIPIDVKIEPPPIKEEEAPFPAQIITILSPLDLQKTSSTTGTIKGYVDDERVDTVYVAVGGVEHQVSVVDQRFSYTATFGQGMNYIVARASITDDGKAVSGYSPRVRVEVDPNLSGLGNVVGQVVDATTSRAVSGVRIRLTATGEVVLTDPHGVYEFRDVPVGETTVELVVDDGDPGAPTP